MSRTLPIPAAAEPLVDAIRDARVFTRPTCRRFLLLMLGLIVTMGRRTVSRALAVMQPMLAENDGHWSDYHRIYSAARFSMWKLAAVLVRQVVALLPIDVAIVLLADDTVHGKAGQRVWAAGAHRDAVRSSRKKKHVKFGHKWLSLCVLVRLPGIDRPWALPILCGLCLSAKVAAKVKRRPKTAAQLARQLLIRLMRWMPDRRFILIGDYQVVTHETACFAARHADRVTAIGRLRGDASFYAEPTRCRRPAGTRGRHQKKGRKLPGPAQRSAQVQPLAQEIQWYGNSRRTVKLVSEQTLWYNTHNAQAVAIRWVGVLGDKAQGTNDAYFYSSDPTMPAARIIELYASRWNIEVTFEEARALLGLETTRHWCRQSVLRVTPLLLGLFTAVALLWARLPKCKRERCQSHTPCYAKQTLTFADALFAVRRELWQQCLLKPRVQHRVQTRCIDALPRRLRQMILWHLAAAA
jgi:Transposase DDE domain